jgi:hypothetical protein
LFFVLGTTTVLLLEYFTTATLSCITMAYGFDYTYTCECVFVYSLDLGVCVCTHVYYIPYFVVHN